MSRGVTVTYLIQSVVSGDRNGVGVHHQPLSQQREEAVCVHDLHFPPAWKQTFNNDSFFLFFFFLLLTVNGDIDCY